MGGALLRLAGCSEFLRNFAAKPQALSCFGVGADDSVRPRDAPLLRESAANPYCLTNFKRMADLQQPFKGSYL